jgi:hypothetical protein
MSAGHGLHDVKGPGMTPQISSDSFTTNPHPTTLILKPHIDLRQFASQVARSPSLTMSF